MQYWKYQGQRVFHQEFGYGRCTGTDDGNIVVAFDVATDGYKERSLQHTSVVLVDAQQYVKPTVEGNDEPTYHPVRMDGKQS